MPHAWQAFAKSPEAALTDIASTGIADHEVARDRGLVRAVGTWGMTASIVNGVVGAGIFSLPAAMAATAGGHAPLAYLACSFAMAAVVICFAEAASRVPTSGGPYGYVEAAFGPMWGFVCGMLLWIASVLACGGIAAALADGIGAFLPIIKEPVWRALLILAVLFGLAWVNIRGVAGAARFIGVATLVKLVPLVIFIVVGGIALASQPIAASTIPYGNGFGRAVILALFAFCGMETPLGASGEVKDPQRTIPRALFISMAFVAVLYIAIQLVAEGLLGAQLGGSATPLADGIARVSPALGVLLVAGAALSRFGWIASDIFGAPRVLFAFARDRMLPQGLAALHQRTKAPYAAILLHAALAAALAITGTFESLVVLSTLATAGLYFLACGAAWQLARKRVAVFGTPLNFKALPVAAVIAMASMVALVLLAEPAEIMGLVGVTLASALAFLLNRALRPKGPTPA